MDELICTVDEMICTKHTTILTLAKLDRAEVRFDHDPHGLTFEERQGLCEAYVMSFEDWAQMGKPEVITITVEPGDRLNGEAE